jgi:hypothetical protein
LARDVNGRVPREAEDMNLRNVCTAIGVAILCAAAAACGSGGPAAPSSASFAGTWVGTAGGGSNLQLTVTQSGDALSGAWTVVDQGGHQSSGTVDGRATGTAMSATLALDPPTTCPINVSGTLDATATHIAGNVASVGCQGSSSDFSGGGSTQGGAFSVTRQ